MDDHTALKDIRKGGQKGYTALYQRYAITLRGYVISKYHIPTDDVEDILQQIFLKFFNTIDTFKQDCSISTWLHEIAKSVAIDHWRAQAKYDYPLEKADDSKGYDDDDAARRRSQQAELKAQHPRTVSISKHDGETEDSRIAARNDAIDALLEPFLMERFQKTQNDLEIQICVEHALAQLKRDGSKASLLKCLNALTFQAQGSSIQEIAKELGKNPDTTRRYLLDCRTRLKQYQPIQRCRELLNGN
jgi:RNA polymerase sigma-70 factor (ECF subfamily)